MPDATRALFQELVQQPMTATALNGGGAVALKLELVEPFAGARHPESFRLLFHGPLQPQLPQNTYWIEHPRLGRQAIFLVPIGRTAEAVQYESIFNRG